MSDPLPPSEDLHSALERVVAPDPPDPEGVAGAVANFAAAVAGPEEEAPVRDYRPREAAIVLAVSAALLLAFDSESLMTWVQRMDLGPVQSGCRAVFRPVNAMMDRAGLTQPRRWIVRSGDSLGQLLGTGEDPLLAEGWDTGLSSDPAVMAELRRPLVAEPPIAEPEDGEPLPDELAPELEDPPGSDLPAEPGPLAAAPVANEKMTVLLMGDSMIAGSLGASLSRAINKDPRMRVVQAYQTATGLARPDVFDWMKVLPSLLEREHPTLIICSLGANDPTRIHVGDLDLEFGEIGWRAAYSARVGGMMRAMSQSGARVLWLGLPPMRAGRFSRHAQYLNKIFARTAKSVPGIEFLELRMLVSDSAGEYATFVPGPDGRLVRYRLDDGIHYSPAGARAITHWIIEWIDERYGKLER
jgi:uncharacterized protein